MIRAGIETFWRRSDAQLSLFFKTGLSTVEHMAQGILGARSNIIALLYKRLPPIAVAQDRKFQSQRGFVGLLSGNQRRQFEPVRTVIAVAISSIRFLRQTSIPAFRSKRFDQIVASTLKVYAKRRRSLRVLTSLRDMGF